jgi:hypothetical protein
MPNVQEQLFSAVITLEKNHQPPVQSGLGGNPVLFGRHGKYKTFLTGNSTASFQLFFIRFAD